MEIYKTIKITSTQYKNYTCPYWNLMSFFCHSQKYCIKIYLFRTKFSIFLTNFSINLTLIFQLFLPEFSKSKFLHVCVYVCVCVRACVRVCVYTLPPAGFFWLHDVCDIREMFGSTIFCCEYYYGLLPSSFISISKSVIFNLQRRKLQPTVYWRENDMI